MPVYNRMSYQEGQHTERQQHSQWPADYRRQNSKKTALTVSEWNQRLKNTRLLSDPDLDILQLKIHSDQNNTFEIRVFF